MSCDSFCVRWFVARTVVSSGDRDGFCLGSQWRALSMPSCAKYLAGDQRVSGRRADGHQTAHGEALQLHEYHARFVLARGTETMLSRPCVRGLKLTKLTDAVKHDTVATNPYVRPVESLPDSPFKKQMNLARGSLYVGGHAALDGARLDVLIREPCDAPIAPLGAPLTPPPFNPCSACALPMHRRGDRPAARGVAAAAVERRVARRHARGASLAVPANRAAGAAPASDAAVSKRLADRQRLKGPARAHTVRNPRGARVCAAHHPRRRRVRRSRLARWGKHQHAHAARAGLAPLDTFRRTLRRSVCKSRHVPASEHSAAPSPSLTAP